MFYLLSLGIILSIRWILHGYTFILWILLCSELELSESRIFEKKSFKGICTAKWVSKNIQYQLENVSFSNTPTFTLIMLVLLITIAKE